MVTALGACAILAIALAIGIVSLVVSVRKELDERINEWQYLESASTALGRILRRTR